MFKLQAISPLGHDNPSSQKVGGFTISEVTDRAMASVAARKDASTDVAAALSAILKKPAPDVGGHVSGDIEAFWTGPNQWMLTAPFKTHEDIIPVFLPKFKGKASMTEQTDGWCRFAVKGGDVVRLCSLVCNLDMRKLVSGTAGRTSIEHVGCFVLRVDAKTVHVMGPRSSAGSLHHALCTAALSADF